MESVASDQGEALTHEGRRAAKSRLFDEFARVAKGLASPKRCELIDLIAQGEHTVENLARKASLSIASASQHLQVLSDAGLVRRRREGTFVHYRLADDDVAGAAWPSYRLTTVEQPVDAMARAAVDVLMARVEGDEHGGAQVRIPGELVVRESARRPAKGVVSMDGREIWRPRERAKPPRARA